MNLHKCTSERDCLMACVATMLQLPVISDVYIPDEPDQWIPALNDFLNKYGCYFMLIGKVENADVRGMHLMVGETARGPHAVVGWRGTVFHDPSVHPLPMDPDSIMYGFIVPYNVMGHCDQDRRDEFIAPAMLVCPEELRADVELHYYCYHMTDRLGEAIKTKQVQHVMRILYG